MIDNYNDNANKNQNFLEIECSQVKNIATSLKAGQRVLLTGHVMTARDAAHKKIRQLIDENQQKNILEMLNNACIYFAGPSQTPPNLPIGSCGPTTSSRMNSYSEMMLEKGVCAFIGKGELDDNSVEALKRHGGVYFVALGGAGALAAKHIKKCEVVAFDDLGCESMKMLYFEKFPVFVAYDHHGGSIFKRVDNEKIEVLN